jgi:hypothetical protein
MSILMRIEEIRAVEHVKLRTALMRVDEALHEVEEELMELRTAARPRRLDLFGEPMYDDTAASAPPPSAALELDLAPLKRAWTPLEAAVLDRLDLWEMKLWPLVRRWVGNESVAREIQQIAADLLDTRSEIDRYLQELRKRALFVEALTQPLHVLFAAVELCDRAEQDEVIPALLSGSRETADRVERSMSGDDIARNLRAAMRTPDRAPERRLDPLGRLLSWMGGRNS